MARSLLLIGVGLLIALPASASGGKKVTSGDQSLRLTASVSASALRLQYVYSSLNPDGSVRESPRRTTIMLPSDLKLHPSQRPVCRVSELNDARDRGVRYAHEICPKGSQVGRGVLTFDGRSAPCEGCVVPLCARPPAEFRVPVEVVNSIIDVRPDGTMRERGGFPGVTLYGHAPYGRTFVLPFAVSHPVLLLRTAQQGFCSWVHVHSFDVTIRRGPARRAYLTLPHLCGPSRTWRFEIAITNYDGPGVAAHDAEPCLR